MNVEKRMQTSKNNGIGCVMVVRQMSVQHLANVVDKGMAAHELRFQSTSRYYYGRAGRDQNVKALPPYGPHLASSARAGLHNRDVAVDLEQLGKLDSLHFSRTSSFATA